MMKIENNKTKLIHLFLTSLIMVLFSCNSDPDKKLGSESKFDSIPFFIKHYKNSKQSENEENIYLSRSLQLNDLINNDTIRKDNFLKIAFETYKNADTSLFKKSNLEAFRLSLKLNDSSGIAESHWNYGSFYADREILDSSYYHYFQAYKFYTLINNENYSAKMLYNMAFIQTRLKDFTSSETKLFQAISTYKKLNKELPLYRCYNALGNIYSEIGDFNNSIIYHDKSLEILDKIKDKKTFYERSLNDIGLTYQIQAEYQKSIKTFTDALKGENLKSDDIDLYARLKDNLAYSKLLQGDTLSVKQYLYDALKIRDSVNNISGMTINILHLSEYYLKINDTTKAVNYAEEGNKLAIRSKNNSDILKSLILLSKSDPKNSSTYLKKHVQLSNELQKYEHTLKNKFARISFETDEYIHENERLSLQKKLITAIAIAVLSIFSLLYYMRIQRAKNKQLVLEKAQQRANEEIYKLMLKQQSNLEEGRLNERHRISEDLHDGIIGKIFGTRMGLAFLDIQGDDQTISRHKLFINELKEIEKEIRVISHDLKNEILNSKSDFSAIIYAILVEHSKTSNFECETDHDLNIDWTLVSDDIKINMYRIVQESLQNISKHAKASLVELKIKKDGESIILLISDNGIGFDNVSNKNSGIGLDNIRARIKSLNGDFFIKSAKYSGTLLTIKIPFS